MRVYVAARFDDRAMVKQVYARLTALGHEISADWTTHQPIAPYGEHAERARQYAVQDLAGVAGAHTFLFLTGPTVGTGSHTELGAAIQANLLTGNPKIFVIGDHNTRSIMYFHPAVTRVNSLEDALASLGSSTSSV